MQLHRALPFAAVTFVLAGLASMGMPGFSGFVAELQVLLGAWKAFPWLAVLTGLGVLIGAAYVLRAMQQAFFGGEAAGAQPDAAPALAPISVPERLGAVLLLAATLVVGLYPPVLLKLIRAGFDSPLMERLVKGGGA
jgi:NADH-quinone oxidoreductase subunit M